MLCSGSFFTSFSVRLSEPGQSPRSRSRRGTAGILWLQSFLALLTCGHAAEHGPLSVKSAAGHWAFLTPANPALPAIRATHWPRTPVDYFIRARLEKASIEPSPEASRSVLIRRLSFGLRGLPPSPSEVAAFLNDDAPDSWERLVDRFLASPAFGVRAAQAWLDAVGYTDSNGYFNADSDRPLAYRYRDYVVSAFNANKPYDQFIREQLAGDEMIGFVRDGDVSPEQGESLVATHFLRNAPDGSGESDGNPLEVKVDRYSVLEGNVHIIGSALLGLTLQCARCHDHKFEPVLQTEYYGLQSILRPAFDPEKWLKPGERVVGLATAVERTRIRQAIELWEKDIETLNKSIQGLIAPFKARLLEANLASLPETVRKDLKKALDTAEKDRKEEANKLLKEHEALWNLAEKAVARRFPECDAALHTLRAALSRRESEKPPAPTTVAHVSEPPTAPPTHRLLIRGNHATEGREVAPTALEALSTPGNRYAADSKAGLRTSGRRLALARWLTSPEHPTVARLMVNRVWKQHFGEGLAATVDNIGVSGSRPTHPELIDFLATELIRSNWDLKRIHRLLVTSAVFRQGSASPSRTPSSDPDNTLLWRMRPRRIDAEEFRDAMLAVSGELSPTLHGPYTPVSQDREGQVVTDDAAPGTRRRSLFMQRKRTAPIHILEVFDAPQLNPACGQRTASTVSLQALTLLNSDFTRRRARGMASRLSNETPVEDAYWMTYSRPPTPAEKEAAIAFLKTQQEVYSGEADAALKALIDCCQMLLASNEFSYLD